MSFSPLTPLLDHTDEIFRQFYDELLSNDVFAIHFNNDQHVQHLLKAQKKNFQDSLADSSSQLFDRYYRIGAIHHKKDIPYEVFLSGSKLLCNLFSELANRNFENPELILLTSNYFSAASDAMAKGFLDCFINEEISDLTKVITLVKRSNHSDENTILVNHYRWLRDLLNIIKNGEFESVDSILKQQENNHQSIYNYITSHLPEIDAIFTNVQIEHMRSRIMSNASSIFFYLKRQAYSDVLALVVNILEIYKLTLILDNLVSNIFVNKLENQITENQRLSETDPLTNVMNRRNFEELLENVITLSRHNSTPVSLTIMDIDNFKQVNDQHGHQIGDRVLIQTANIIESATRKHDHLIRYGGEEFIIISNDTDQDGAIAMAEKIRRQYASANFENVGQLTMSIGVATLIEEDTSSSILSRADSCLYLAKNTGKNKVVNKYKSDMTTETVI